MADASKASLLISDAVHWLSLAGHSGQMHTLGGGDLLTKGGPIACPPAEGAPPTCQAVLSELPVNSRAQPSGQP